jgi:outer membrane protein assembly factor BamA
MIFAAPAEAGGAQAILGVSVFGNHHLDRGLILRSFGLKQGDDYTSEAAEGGLARVRALHGVNSASHRITQEAQEDGVYIQIIITEESARSFGLVAKRNFTNKIGVGFRFSDLNFRQRNEELGVSAMFRGATIVNLGWKKPPFFPGSRICLGLRAEYRRYRWPYPSFDGLFIDDLVRRLDTSLLLGFALHRSLILYIAAGAEWIDVAEPMLTGQGESGVPDAPGGTFPTIEAGLDFSRMDRRFYPKSGLRFHAAAKRYDYIRESPLLDVSRYSADAAIFLNLHRAFLSIDSRGSVHSGDIPVYMLEHLGGVSTIRGHEFGVFYGENSLLVRSDLRIPLNFRDLPDLGNPMILVALDIFLDTGAVWNERGELGTDRFYSGAGLGLDIIPAENWLIKVGYAWPMSRDGRFLFDIGTMF